MNIRLVIITFAICIILFSDFYVACAQVQGRKEQYIEERILKDAMIKKSLSSFVFGIREKLPGFVMSYYKPFAKKDEKIRRIKELELQKNLIELFQYFSTDPGEPFVLITKPDITWIGDEATVRCSMIWSTKNNKGENINLKTDEEFIFTLIGEHYVITSAKTIPLLIKHFNDSDTLKMKLNMFGSGGQLW